MIYVDGDACPVREEVFRVATRLGLNVVVVSNGSRPVRPPGLPNVEMVLVKEGADAADDWIAERIGRGDVCVTADIPLAAAAIAKGGIVMDPRGERFTPDNIEERLALRSFMEEMRSSGVQTGGPAPFSARDQKAFADQLDKLMHQLMRDAS